MAFEPRHLDLQFKAPLADRHRLVMQPKGLDFFFLGSPARDLVQRVLQPLPLPRRLCMQFTKHKEQRALFPVSSDD